MTTQPARTAGSGTDDRWTIVPPSSAWSAVTRLDERSFESMLKSHDLERARVIDLRNIRFAAPSGLVGLLLAVEASARFREGVILTVPDGDFRRYLSRSRFTELAHPTCRLDPAASDHERGQFAHRYGKSSELIELTRLETEGDLLAFQGRTRETLTKRMGYSVASAFRVVSIIAESGRNLIEHSGLYGYAALQLYTTQTGRFIELAIGDGGRGIRDRLSLNPEYRRTASDLQAIQLAIQPGVSSFGRERGIGLPALLMSVRMHGGSVQIRSGTGRVRMRASRPGYLWFEGVNFPGTQLTISLPAAAVA